MSSYHDRMACLVDGDNMTSGGQRPVDDVSRVLERLAALMQGWPVTFAVQRRLAVDYMLAYAGRGWGLRFASMAPDAADHELLQAADEFVAHDVRDLIVASGDHAFAELAGRARLHVFSYRNQLSRQLRLAATTVTYLDDLVAPRAA